MPFSPSVTGLDGETIRVEAAERESGKWAERRLLERSEHGGESYIKASERLFGQIVSAQQIKEDVEQTQREQRP